VNVKCFVTGFVAAVMFFGVQIASAEEAEPLRLTQAVSLSVPMGPKVVVGPVAKRPAVLPALYVSLGAMQALDIYSTRAALKAGARESNAVAAPFAGNTASMLGLKVASTAGTILFAERMWKTNKVGAIVMLAAINSATAAVSMHNMRNAKIAAGR